MIEAKRIDAATAVLLVQAFASDMRALEDAKRFAALLGADLAPGRAAPGRKIDGVQVQFVWVDSAAGEGGRIRLVKHVHAEPDVLDEMYGAAFAEFLEHKRRLDPHGVLRNAFFDRLAAACARR